MKNNSVNVFIYIQSRIDPNIVSEMATKIGQITGVNKANVNPKLKRLLAVEYNPQSISADALLDVVEKNGYHGALVGM